MTKEQIQTIDNIIKVYTLKPPIIIDGKRFEISQEQYNTIISGTEEAKIVIIDWFNTCLCLSENYNKEVSTIKQQADLELKVAEGKIAEAQLTEMVLLKESDNLITKE